MFDLVIVYFEFSTTHTLTHCTLIHTLTRFAKWSEHKKNWRYFLVFEFDDDVDDDDDDDDDDDGWIP